MALRSPLVSAWVGQGNFGDELLAYGLRLALHAATGLDRVSYYNTGPHSVYQAPSDINIVISSQKGESRLSNIKQRIFHSFSNHDAFFFGGGSILHSLNSIAWKLDLARRFRRGGTGLLGSVGISAGPFQNKEAENAAILFLRQMDVVLCRDLRTTEFASLAAPDTEIIHARDLAFWVRQHRPQLFQCQKISTIGISFILDARLNKDIRNRHFTMMLAIVNLLTSKGYKIRLIALNYSTSYQDNVLHSTLRDHAQHPHNIELYTFTGDVITILQKISECSHYISMRLHGLISAFLSGVPILGLTRQLKQADFINDLKTTSSYSPVDFDMSLDDILAHVQSFVTSARSVNYDPLHDPVFVRGDAAFTQHLQNFH